MASGWQERLLVKPSDLLSKDNYPRKWDKKKGCSRAPWFGAGYTLFLMKMLDVLVAVFNEMLAVDFH